MNEILNTHLGNILFKTYLSFQSLHVAQKNLEFHMSGFLMFKYKLHDKSFGIKVNFGMYEPGLQKFR